MCISTLSREGIVCVLSSLPEQVVVRAVTQDPSIVLPSVLLLVVESGESVLALSIVVNVCVALATVTVAPVLLRGWPA